MRGLYRHRHRRYSALPRIRAVAVYTFGTRRAHTRTFLAAAPRRLRTRYLPVPTHYCLHYRCLSRLYRFPLFFTAAAVLPRPAGGPAHRTVQFLPARSAPLPVPRSAARRDYWRSGTGPHTYPPPPFHSAHTPTGTPWRLPKTAPTAPTPSLPAVRGGCCRCRVPYACTLLPTPPPLPPPRRASHWRICRPFAAYARLPATRPSTARPCAACPRRRRAYQRYRFRWRHAPALPHFPPSACFAYAPLCHTSQCRCPAPRYFQRAVTTTAYACSYCLPTPLPHLLNHAVGCWVYAFPTRLVWHAATPSRWLHSGPSSDPP